ncbi:probable serine/threonine-protein kinase STY13 at C-terminar half [Coccomyxa sp. Obi]|nr:probable serine/threonine-protein kinase STY13 at C-terminar half [Coccomyxa sp. Obi]
MGGCASAPADRYEPSGTVKDESSPVSAQAEQHTNGRSKSLDCARISAEERRQDAGSSRSSASPGQAPSPSRPASCDIQSARSTSLSSTPGEPSRPTFSKPPLPPVRASSSGALQPFGRSAVPPDDSTMQGSPASLNAFKPVSSMCSSIAEDGAASGCGTAVSPGQNGEKGRPGDLQQAMSVPEHMLLGHSPPLSRTQSLYSGSGAARVPRTTLPLPSASSSKLFEQAPEPSVDHILGLAMSVFRTDSVLLHLRDGDQVFARGGNDTFTPGIRAAVCRLLEPAGRGICVVEDIAADVRLKDRPDIVEEVKFFAATPLIAANGYRLGSLCLCHSKPHKFDMTTQLIISSMSDLMVREIWGAYEHAHKQRIMQLIRVVDCYSEPLLFVEASQTQPWRLLHLNDSAASNTGLEASAVAEKPFWDVFKGVEESNAVKLKAVSDCSSCGLEFELEGMQASSAETAAVVPFTLTFRPAAMEALADGCSAEGAADAEKQRPISNAGRHYYFVGVRLDADAALTSAAERSPFVGLQLGLLLGKGAYGRVYKGYYHGKVVAVKVCDSSKVRRNKAGVPIEADVSAHLAHPNLVRTIDTATAYREPLQKLDWEVKQDAAADGTNPASQQSSKAESPTTSPTKSPAKSQSDDGPIEETWLLLEYCDQGSFVDAVVGGWFRVLPDGPPNLTLVLCTAGEIASGMAHLHSRGIVHGDLSSGNVLLTSCTSNPHGFCAKVSDFGLARDMEVVSRVETKTTGTVTHMPPEVLSHGIISKAADVFAFGVLLWEMLSGERAWNKQTPAQVMMAVALQQNMLTLPPTSLPELNRLGQRCLSFEPEDRPTFQELQREITALQSRAGSSASDDRVSLGPRAFSCPH